MIAPVSLSNLFTVATAIMCLWTIGSQSSGGVIKLWRLALPPCLAAVVALILLASIFNATMAHDAEWTICAILGGVIGLRSWSTWQPTRRIANIPDRAVAADQPVLPNRQA